MKVRYIGPHMDGVELDAIGVFVAHGDTVEVSDDLAASLLEQPSNWEAVKPPVKVKTDPVPEED